jgi:hypothetical protein
VRQFIISALTATLVGCTWIAPQPPQQASSIYAAAGMPQMHSKTVAKTEIAIAANKEGSRDRRKATRTKKARSNTVLNVPSCVQPNDKPNASINAKSAIATKTETPQSQPDNTSNTSTTEKSTVVTKTEMPQSSQLDDKFDPVIKKAMPTIAAKMENSASIELVEMKRAEKNASGKSIDTICGYVRGRTASGTDTGDRPFLYLVQENQAYIGGYDMATSPYHNLCRQ